jgi:hypothetical protein
MHGGSLVGKSGEVVTREDMQPKLWPADISAGLKPVVALSSSDARIGGPGESQTPDRRLRKTGGRVEGC